VSRLLYVVLGALFGYILHQGRVTDYDTIIAMFRPSKLADAHLMGVMGAAIGSAALGLFVLRRLRAAPVIGGEMDVKPKPMRPWIFVAGLVFGTGWALTGA
jgi:hypothetical protein